MESLDPSKFMAIGFVLSCSLPQLNWDRAKTEAEREKFEKWRVVPRPHMGVFRENRRDLKKSLEVY